MPDAAEVTFALVPADRVTLVWAGLRPCFEIVRRKTNSPWLPEDVYTEIREARASLHLAFIEGALKGLFVLSAMNDRYTNERILVIWVAFSSDPRIIDPCMEEIDKVARAAGIRRIISQSPRKGWIRRLRGHGYSQTEIVLEKRLEN